MTRTVLVAATSLIAAALLLSPAQACISCEYVPEVVRNHTTSNEGGSYNSSRRSHAYAARRAAPKCDGDEGGRKAAKVARSSKASKNANVAKLAKPQRSEPVKVAKAEPVAKKSESKSAQDENSSISPAGDKVAAKDEKTPVQEVAVKQTDCKKFFASVGMTLTVPCE
ncbi:MAG: hypothetical protein WC829_18445 [Hyphomicrobium sp.]